MKKYSYSDSASVSKFKNLSASEIKAAMIAGNQQVIKWFFFEECDNMFKALNNKIFDGEMEIAELVQEIYLFLAKDKWHKLETFIGKNGCSLKSWLNKIAMRHLLQMKDRLQKHDGDSLDNVSICISYDNATDISLDMKDTFSRMNERYVTVIRLMLFEGYDAAEVAEMLNTAVSNVYNIKSRALAQFREVYGRSYGRRA